MAIYLGTNFANYYNYMGSEQLYAYGYGGNDTILGNTNRDYIDGGDGNDDLYGWWGNDTLLGGSGSDYLSGGGDDDRLTGSTSRSFNSNEYDTLVGGSGWDIFVLGSSAGNYYQGSGYALITDYNGANDYIQIKNTGSLSLSWQSWAGSSALDTAIYQGGDLIGVVQDNTSIALTSYYFQFV
ncbi:MAG: calcium-binding protein [Microcystis aeruginosa W13-15]|jgi:Ca2+-binding RTX toxin-like protein|nr:calcium-binding protein [Microcystis aeruginosa W13-16]NCQ73317.1 calcium-binding protein [Microcystis aeruginosa W13-13]NCQ77806.1 calcium-binding protein [Microcystis aeruginosa W13-15]NCS43179.1 calcium-binding protein [Microcystis aeruginosa BS11-05]NCT52664.1 calcium-binding protein [Microcystis aeruginosa G13-03]